MTSIEIETIEYGYNVKSGKITGTVDVTKLPMASIEKLLAYGVQRFINDATGGEKTDEELAEIVAGKLEALKSGEFRKGGGGKRLDDVTKELRTMVEEKIISAKYLKAAEARKMATDPHAAFVFFVSCALGARMGVKEKDVPQEKVSEAVAKNWPAMVAKAEEEVARRQAALGDLDLDIEL